MKDISQTSILLGLVIGMISMDHSMSFSTIRPVAFHHQVVTKPSISNLINGEMSYSALFATSGNDNDTTTKNADENLFSQLTKGISTVFLASTILLNVNVNISPNAPGVSFQPPSAYATDGLAIAKCLFAKCQLPLAKCIANPKCLANVICINTCNDKADETGCQIECGNIFENDVVGEFNKCAVSDMTCVPQKDDDGSYPVPANDLLVQKFDTSLWNGRWYITAGQNKLFDRFPCQVHFFTETAPGKFFGKLNWRIEEPDGEFFTRDALQRFVQDPKQPAHLINHDNDYLHYQDDWYIIDYEPDNNPSGTPPFALVYYRGSNDAWVGYGGAVVYTRDSKLPESLIPRLREGAKKINYDFDKDFEITDNTCKALEKGEEVLLREKFAGKMAIQTEEQLQQQAVLARKNAVNAVKAQELFLEDEVTQVEKAFITLEKKAVEFEKEIVNEVEKDIVKIEKEVEKDILTIEKDVVDEVETIEKTIFGFGKKK